MQQHIFCLLTIYFVLTLFGWVRALTLYLTPAFHISSGLIYLLCSQSRNDSVTTYHFNPFRRFVNEKYAFIRRKLSCIYFIWVYIEKRPVLLTVKIGFTPGNLCLALFIECKSVIFLVGPYWNFLHQRVWMNTKIFAPSLLFCSRR